MSILKSTNVGWNSYVVDLGLSVRWCSCNVGAKKPEEYGLYFSWGCLKGYEPVDVAENMFSEEWYKKLPPSEYNKNLGTQEDAANYVMQGNWRMPTKYECEELCRYTNQEVKEVNGVQGIRFISKKNGNSIFVPYSGYVENGEISKIKIFCLWASNWCSSDIRNAFFIEGHSNGIPSIHTYHRHTGMNIRGVLPC